MNKVGTILKMISTKAQLIMKLIMKLILNLAMINLLMNLIKTVF